MAEKKKRKWRHAYVTDYKQTMSGEYIYTGKVYHYAGGAEEWKRVFRLMWLLAGAGFVSVVLAGCVNVPGMRNCVYVIAPYVITFGLSLSCVWAMFRLTGEREGKVKEYVYDATVTRLKGLTIIQTVCSVLAAAGETVFLFLSAEERRLLTTLAFVGLQLLAAALSLASRRFGSLYKWEKTDS